MLHLAVHLIYVCYTLQFQTEIEELNFRLKLKDEELKKSKEDNRLLLKKRLAESKESKLPVPDTSNVVCMIISKHEYCLLKY